MGVLEVVGFVYSSRHKSKGEDDTCPSPRCEEGSVDTVVCPLSDSVCIVKNKL